VVDQWTAALARRVSRLDLRQRVGLQIALDSAALVLGLAAAQVGRFDFDLSALADWGLWVVAALAVCLLHFMGTALHLYLGRYRFGGSDEVLGIGVSVVLTVVGTVGVTLALGEPRPVPISVPPLGGAMTILVMFGVRYLWRRASRSSDPARGRAGGRRAEVPARIPRPRQNHG
jgi:FlaA1/EpsC-like NDP-sugar epimerase